MVSIDVDQRSIMPIAQVDRAVAEIFESGGTRCKFERPVPSPKGRVRPLDKASPSP